MALLHLRAPAGGTLLATSDAASQAYRIDDHAWGIQFHAEVTREMLENWFVDGERELAEADRDRRAETDRLIGPGTGTGARCARRFSTRACGRPSATQPVSAGQLGSFDHSCHEPG